MSAFAPVADYRNHLAFVSFDAESGRPLPVKLGLFRFAVFMHELIGMPADRIVKHAEVACI